MGLWRALLVALTLAVLVLPVAGEESVLTADEVVRRVKEAFGEVDDYRVRVAVHVDIEGFPVPDREIVLFYKCPDRIHLEGADFAMLPRQGVMADPSQILDEDRYLIRSGTTPGQVSGICQLNLHSKADSVTDSPDLVAWIDSERWVVTRMEAYSEGRKQGTVTIGHDLVGNRFWLPARTEVEIFMGTTDPGTAPGVDDDSSKSSRQPEKGTIQLTFSDYEVNIGLPDSLFDD